MIVYYVVDKDRDAIRRNISRNGQIVGSFLLQPYTRLKHFFFNLALYIVNWSHFLIEKKTDKIVRMHL